MFALVVYHLRKSIKCLLNAWPSPRQAPASLTPAHYGLAAGGGVVFAPDQATVLIRSMCNSTAISDLAERRRGDSACGEGRFAAQQIGQAGSTRRYDETARVDFPAQSQNT
jgi:hypothetical protein